MNATKQEHAKIYSIMEHYTNINNNVDKQCFIESFTSRDDAVKYLANRFYKTVKLLHLRHVDTNAAFGVFDDIYLDYIDDKVISGKTFIHWSIKEDDINNLALLKYGKDANH